MSGGMGFVQPNDKPVTGLDLKVKRAAVEAARRKFSPEFMNRLDKVVVFHPLRRDHLEQVLEIELAQVQQRVFETAKGQFLLRVTGPGREFLLQEGTDQRYGARISSGPLSAMLSLLLPICLPRIKYILATWSTSIGSQSGPPDFHSRRRRSCDAGSLPRTGGTGAIRSCAYWEIRRRACRDAPSGRLAVRRMVNSKTSLFRPW